MGRLKIAVWGAGNVGAGLVHRLATSDFTDEILWINHNLEKVDRQAADVKHGLAMVPKVCDVHPISQARVRHRLVDVDILVLTQGKGVPVGGTRAAAFAANCQVFEPVIDAVAAFQGVILVVSNPVDLMTRHLLVNQPSLSPNRVMGLGTVVETSRLRFAIADRLINRKHPRDINAYAIGTHDENFVPIIQEPDFPVELYESVRLEVAQGAKRVKGSDQAKPGATVFPIVEGCVSVIRAVATNIPTCLTVSVLDSGTEDRLCYSLPCFVDGSGWKERDSSCVRQHAVQSQIDTCLIALRAVLSAEREQ